MRSFSSIAIAALVFAPVFAGPPSSQTLYTGGTLNGHFWQTLGGLEKILFLNGYTTALSNIMNADARLPAKKYFVYYPASMSFHDVSTALDQLYAVPENDRILVPHALEIIALRVSGAADEAAVQERIEFYRAIARNLDKEK